MPSLLVPVIALAASLTILLLHGKQRFLPVLGVLVSMVQLLVSSGILRLVASGPIPIAMGSIFVVVGVFVYAKEGTKHVVAAATALAVIGVLQVASALSYKVL